MNGVYCPGDDQLNNYAHGLLPEEYVEGLERHLEDCSICSDRIDRLAVQFEPVISLLQTSSDLNDSTFLNEEEYSSLVQKFASLPVVRSGDSVPSKRETEKSSSAVSPISPPRASLHELGPYLLVDIIGRGGMGTVYKAQHQSLRTTVAVKVIRSHRFQDVKARERFRREMEAAGKIIHPNVVQARDAGEFDGIHFLAMEFVDGQDLSALLKHHERLSVAHACEIIRMAAMGLQAIHHEGMVHRDLKPGNLMLARNGEVKILDLGLALLHPQHATSIDELTSTGQLMGTIDYMSPEQADDTHGVDLRADIYGLGATLFALLTGRGPLGDKHQSVMKKLSFLANKSAPSVKSIRVDIPEPLSEIVAKMIHRDPQQRFSTAEEVCHVLASFASSEGLTDLLPCKTIGQMSDEFLISTASLEDTIVLAPVNHSEKLTTESFEAGSFSRNSIRTFWRVALPIGVLLILAMAFAVFRGKGSSSNDVDGVLNGNTAVVSATGSKTEPKNANELGPELDSRAINPAVAPASLNEATANSSLETLQANARISIGELLDPLTVEHWRVFSGEVAQDVRAYAIHHAHEKIPAEVLLRRLQVERSSSIRAGMLLAISEFEQQEILKIARSIRNDDSGTASKDLFEELLFWYVNDPDSEVHACLGYLLRQWQQHEMLQRLRPILEQKLTPFEGGWYQPLHVSEMVVVPGPTEAVLGSPSKEVGRNSAPEQIEDLRTVLVPRTFAICSTEVTQYQYWRTSDRYWDSPAPEDPDAPLNAIPWRSAAEFCNRLSELEGIPPAEHCYYAVEGPAGLNWRQKENALELTGYRLPTDEEWEVACRAGTSAIRPFGEETTFLHEYVRGEQPAGGRLNVGSLKPNSFGLFDMLGNVAEWIHSDPSSISTERGLRRARGGSAWTPSTGLRSAARYVFENTSPKVGFRVARTLILRPYRLPSESPRLSEIEIEVGPAACPEELTKYVDQRFQPLLQEQVVSLGNWNVQEVPTRRFRVRNPTDKDIVLENLPWMNDYFEFAPAPSNMISAGDISEFGIRMNVAGVGERLHDLHFKWGPPTSVDRTEFDFPPVRLHGCFEGPLLDVMGIGQFGGPAKSFDLGTVPVGSVVGKTFFLINIGNRAVEAEVVDVSGPFSVSSPLQGSIIPHKIEKSFRMTVGTTSPGLHQGQVRLRTREKRSVEFSFPLQVVVSELDRFSSLGVYRNGIWLLDHNRDGKTDEEIVFGMSGDRPLTGDWNGDGVCDLAVWRRDSEGRIRIEQKLRGEKLTPQDNVEVQFPPDAIRAVAADRDGDGRTEFGYILSVPERNSLIWRFDTAHDGEYSDREAFGRPDDDTIIGDWNGDGIDDLAVSRPANLIAPGARVWQMTWKGLAVPRDLIYLSPLDAPLAGDWDSDGDDDPGGWRPVTAPGLCVWQFETNGDGHSNNELEGFGTDADIPVILRNR